MAPHEFGKSRMFCVGPDSIIMGKRGIINAVLNMGSHIYKGCFNYYSLTFGLEFYQESHRCVSKGHFAGIVPVETALGQNEIESHFRVTNLSTKVTTTLGDPELEGRLELSMLHQNYAVDVRHGINVPPNPIYWCWSRLNHICFSVLGVKVYNFKDPMQVSLVDEPFLGYGSYRYEEAILNQSSPEEALEHAMDGFRNIKTRNRWVYFPVINWYNAMSLTTAPTTRKPTVSSTNTPAITPPTAVPTIRTQTISSCGKRKRVAAIRSTSKDVSNLGNRNATIKKFLRVSKPKTNDTIRLIRKAYVKELEKSCRDSFDVTSVAQTVAGVVNTAVIQAANDPSAKLSLPTLVSSAGVARTMFNDANNLAQGKTKGMKKKRNNYKNKPIQELYPLTRSELVNGMKQNRAIRIVRDLKNNYKRAVCDSNKGLTAPIPKSKFKSS